MTADTQPARQQNGAVPERRSGTTFIAEVERSEGTKLVECNGQVIAMNPEQPPVQLQSPKEPAITKYPHGYTPELGAEVCRLVAERGNLEQIGKDNTNGLPGKTALYAWKRDVKEFADDYARAREDRADARSDRVDDIMLRVESGELTPQQGLAMFRAEQWQASHENPQRYGDKQIIEGGDKPVQHVHSIPALDKLMSKVDAIAAKTIEHDPDEGA